MTSKTECKAVQMTACAFADDDVEDELHDAFNESYRSCKALVRCLRKTSSASDKGRESSKCNESKDEHNPCDSCYVR